MGLAAYGKPTFDLTKVIKIIDGVPSLNRRYVNDQWRFVSFHPLEPRYTSALLDDLGFSRRTTIESIRDEDRDLAASAQLHLQKTVRQLIEYYLDQTGLENLVLTGGVALNSKMCGYLNNVLPIKNMYVPQLPSDGCLAIGSAIESVPIKDRPRLQPFPLYSSFSYSQDECESALALTRQTYKSYSHDRVLDLLQEGKVIGYFSGPSEFGPRSLGARSIIADPKSPEMKDIVNSKIKFRENFRPFAPIVRDVDFDKYFVRGSGNYEFMNFVIETTDFAKEFAPAIVHEDGTSRAQLLLKGVNNRLYELLGLWLKKTGSGVLLNTSFNLKGEPIVETPNDAIRTFYSSGLDALVLEDSLLVKN